MDMEPLSIMALIYGARCRPAPSLCSTQCFCLRVVDCGRRVVVPCRVKDVVGMPSSVPSEVGGQRPGTREQHDRRVYCRTPHSG